MRQREVDQPPTCPQSPQESHGERGSSQTLGSLGHDDFLDELHLKNLHDLDDRHKRFLKVSENRCHKSWRSQ